MFLKMQLPSLMQTYFLIEKNSTGKHYQNGNSTFKHMKEKNQNKTRNAEEKYFIVLLIYS